MPDDGERARKRALGRTLQADLSRLLLWHPFTAGLAMQLEIVPLRDWRVPTAATDGRHIFFDIDFAETLTPSERLFVLGHELWHSALGHSERRGQREWHRWGLAADSEINALLQEDGLHAPAHAVLFEEKRGCSAEQIYAWLRDGPKRRWSAMRSFDVHELRAGVRERGQAPVEDPDFRPATDGDRTLRRQWRERLVRTGQIAALRGMLPAGLSCVVRRLVEPQVPWPQLLRQFLHGSRGGAWNWTRPSRRHLWRGVWLPSRSEGNLRLVVGLDTSGSALELQAGFLSELRSIVQAFGRFEILVLECDTKIQRETLVTDADGDDWVRRFQIEGVVGGGGTDFRPIFERALLHEAELLVLFTDGYGSVPEHAPALPVLWALAGEGAQVPVQWGAVLTLDVLTH